MHRDFILQALTLLLFLRLAHMIVDGLQQPLDVLVLRFVKGLQLAFLGSLLDRLGHADLALARCVCLDPAEFVGGLEAMA
jgi:hypothetical protein